MSINFEKQYKQIVEMNRLVGNQYSDKDLIPLYINLTFEETGEIAEDSFRDHDNKEFIDGLIDSLVTGYFLFKLNRPNSNQYKFNLDDKTISISTMAKHILSLRQYRIEETINDNIESILTMLEEIANSINNQIDMGAVFDEIMRSNMTKFPIVGEVDIEKEIKFIENKYQTNGFYTKEVDDSEGNKRVVFYNSKGKFVKPSCFEEPEIKQFIPSDFDIIRDIKQFI